MELLEAIRTRRSVRSYKDRPIPEDLLERILTAAMSAPSAGNAQPWQFIVVSRPELREAVPAFSPYAGMIRQAPLGILVCGDLSLEKYPGYWVQDCSAATQNLLLAAHDLGLGAVWTGVHPMTDRVEGFRGLLKLPRNIMPLAFVVLGWPDKTPAPENRFKPERVHRDGFPGVKP